MGEPLSSTASVIAVIQISSKVIASCARYAKEVRNAKDDIERLQSTVRGIENVSKGIKALLDGMDAQKQLKVSQELSKPLAHCKSQLEDVSNQLELGKMRKTMSCVGMRAIKWPFKSYELNRLLVFMEQTIQIFSAALQVDQTRILLNFDKKIGMNSRNAELFKLPRVAGASYDAHEEEYNATCLEDTRIELRDQIQDWAIDSGGKSVYWLNGVAGTGKSTIARTMAQSFAEQSMLGASFFFKRGAGDRSNASRFFTTIAWQLATHFPVLADLVAEATRTNTDIASKNLATQFDKLILQPLSVGQTPSLPTTLLLVVDALDECEREEDVQTIVGLLALAKDAKCTHLRVFVTSRPELPIRLGFKKVSTTVYETFILHEVAVADLEHDIALFLKHEFDDIRDTYELDTDWPGEAAISQLAHLAVPLFISAATVCRYIRESAVPPKKQLEYFLTSATASKAPGMDRTYLPVLNQLLDGKSEVDRAQITRDFKVTIGAIALLASPLSIVSLSKLLQISEDDISWRLRQLHSVVQVPFSRTTPIRLYHTSFRDFLLDPLRKDSPFWVDEKQIHEHLAHRCLALLMTSPCLKQDICNKKHPGTQRDVLTKAEINHALPPEVQYACRYWAHHVKGAGSLETDILNADSILSFVRNQLLFWLEALALIGYARESIGMMQALHTIPAIQKYFRLAMYIQDALSFILQYIVVIEKAPLQLYSSALIFAPENSITRTLYKELVPQWINQPPRVQKDWNACVQTFEGHSEAINVVIFSPDGQTVISGSDDLTVKLWDINGVLRRTLQGHERGISTLAVSSDGDTIASGSFDGTVKLWDAVTGELRKTLEHSGSVFAVAISPDGQTIASGSFGSKVWLWDAARGEVLNTPEHCYAVFEIVFSPDGQTLASGLSEGAVELRDTATGELRNTLEHSRRVHAIAFSPDGQTITTISGDSKIFVWDVAIGVLRSTLEGHFAIVHNAKFSTDGKTVMSSSFSTIKLRDTATGTILNTLDDHSDTVHSVAFSPNGHMAVSGSRDTTITLWDTTVAIAIHNMLENHEDDLWVLKVSPDGQAVATGGKSGVKIWDAATGALLDTIEAGGYVNQMSFEDEGLSLCTNRGMLKSKCLGLVRSNLSPIPPEKIDVKKSWVVWEGKNLLWLPPEYRVPEEQTHRLAICGARIAIGRRSGHVSIMGFDTEIIRQTLES